MASIRGHFDCDGFYRALDAVRADRNLNWKQLGQQCSVSASTLTRMAQGRRPDADSLAMLAAWSGLNPASFVTDPSVRTSQDPGTLAQIHTYLRADPNLSKEAIDALEEMITVAYRQFKKMSEGAGPNEERVQGGS